MCSGFLGLFVIGISIDQSMSTCELACKIIKIFPVIHFRKLKCGQCKSKFGGKRRYSNVMLAFDATGNQPSAMSIHRS